MRNSINEMKAAKENNFENVNVFIDSASAERIIKNVKGMFSKRVKVLNSLSPLEDITEGSWVIPTVRLFYVEGSISKESSEWTLCHYGLKMGTHKTHLNSFPNLARRNADSNMAVRSTRTYIEGDKLIFEFVGVRR